MPADIEATRNLLNALIDAAESSETQSELDGRVEVLIATIINSQTGAYRQALLGTVLIKLLHPDLDLTLPSIEHGEKAYSGRTVDEMVVMPSLRIRRIPVSQSSAYLSTLRRGKRFIDEDVVGVRDRATYLAANAFVAWLQEASSDQARDAALRLLKGFLDLRAAVQIELIDLPRIDQPQLIAIISGLLRCPRGGRWPAKIVLATIAALNEVFDLGWTTEAQGINSADASSGSVGDITVKRGGHIVFGVEVTERRVDSARVRTAMTEKVMVKSVRDYLYLVTMAPAPDAEAIARNYFGQGYGVTFLDVQTWAANTLALTSALRAAFVRHIRAGLSDDETPASLKVDWNEVAASLA